MRSMVSPDRLGPVAPFLPRPPDPGAPVRSAPDPCVVPTISVMLFLFLRRVGWVRRAVVGDGVLGERQVRRRWRACGGAVDVQWTCSGHAVDGLRPSVGGRVWGTRPPARVSGAGFLAGATEIGDLLLEVFYGGERAIDAREAEISHLVELAQRTEDGQPDLVAGDLGGTPGPDGLLDAVGELGERVLVDGPALAGSSDAADDLLAAERLGDAAALDDGEHGL